MEMKSVADDKPQVGPGVETPKPKLIARKSTSVPRKREPKPTVEEDDMCSIRIYEVLGNVKDHPQGAAGLSKGKNPKKKSGKPDDSIVIGDEVLLRITSSKDPFNTTKEEELLDLARLIQAEKAAQKKFIPYFQKNEPSQNASSSSTAEKTIASESPSQSDKNDSAGVVKDTKLDVPGPQDSENTMVHGKEKPVMDSSYSSPKKADDDDDDDDDKEIEKEMSIDEVSTMEEVPNEGEAGEKVDVVVEVNGSDIGTSNEVSAMEESAEDKREEEEKDVPDEVPNEVSGEVPNENSDDVPIEDPNEHPIEEPDKDPIKVPDEDPSKLPDEDPIKVPGDKIVQVEDFDFVSEVEEVVVSSGSAWTNEDQARSEFYDTSGIIDDDDDDDEGELIGELKIDESGSTEFSKKFTGNSGMKKGITIEIREKKMLKTVRVEEKRVIQDGEIGSVAGEIEEGNKRKRIRKSGGTKKLNPKKRKVEKSKKNESDDEKNKGKSNADKSTKKDFAKPVSSICNHSTLEETIDRVASGHLSLPFIESLRGEIKSLTRGDLEELIVQKLCEVITERSTVGHLRKRAEALEKSQERWKERVLSLTKQMKEMDMVMKNYLSEVRKHQNEKSFQMVAPLRVTRSVGLQVSFTSSHSKLAKTLPKYSGETRHGREKGGKQSHRNVQVSQTPNKHIPILPSTSSSRSLIIDSKNKFSTKSGLTITLQPASSSTEAQTATKSVQIQPSKLSILPAADSPTSNLIDLTGDDDRQTEDIVPDTSQQTVTVGPPGQVKVVNHIQPVQPSVGAVTLLISNPTNSPCSSTTSASGSASTSASSTSASSTSASSTSASSTSASSTSASSTSASSTSDSQNRQLVIAGSSGQSAQRHILPAIPTLIYKANALIQPGSHAAASQSLSAGIKLTKHPAPLPQPPLNQIHKPNWKLLPPRPALKISKGDTGIVLSWNMTLGPEYETIVSYQLFAYQESDSPPSSSMWKRVGDVKALRLPMACTLSQFLTGYRYYFAVRAVDMHSRVGPFSYPSSIALIG